MSAPSKMIHLLIFGVANKCLRAARGVLFPLGYRVPRISLLDTLAKFLMRFLDNMHIVLNASASVHLD